MAPVKTAANAPLLFGSPGTGLRLMLRGDGKRYSIWLPVDSRGGLYFRSPAYAVAGTTTIELPLERFKAERPTSPGRADPSLRLDPSRVIGVGFTVAQQQAGPFELAVLRIELLG